MKGPGQSQRQPISRMGTAATMTPQQDMQGDWMNSAWNFFSSRVPTFGMQMAPYQNQPPHQYSGVNAQPSQFGPQQLVPINRQDIDNALATQQPQPEPQPQPQPQGPSPDAQYRQGLMNEMTLMNSGGGVTTSFPGYNPVSGQATGKANPYSPENYATTTAHRAAWTRNLANRYGF